LFPLHSKPTSTAVFSCQASSQSAAIIISMSVWKSTRSFPFQGLLPFRKSQKQDTHLLLLREHQPLAVAGEQTISVPVIFRLFLLCRFPGSFHQNVATLYGIVIARDTWGGPTGISENEQDRRLRHAEGHEKLSESSINPGSSKEWRTYGVTKIPVMRGQNLPSAGSTKIVAVAPVDTAVRAVASP
jgi:hypothetical protein